MNDQPLKILFVCTDNYTRSIVAELCLKDYLSKNKLSGFRVSSAGIKADSDTSKYWNTHFDRMSELGIDLTSFRRTQFVKDNLNEYDLIVGMGLEHKDYFLSEYQVKIPLFNEIYKDIDSGVVVSKPGSGEDVSKQLMEMVDYIHNSMPQFVKNIPKFIKK